MSNLKQQGDVSGADIMYSIKRTHPEIYDNLKYGTTPYYEYKNSNDETIYRSVTNFLDQHINGSNEGDREYERVEKHFMRYQVVSRFSLANMEI